MEEKRKEILRGLEAELAATEESMGIFDARYTNAVKVLDQLKSGKYIQNYVQHNIMICMIVTMRI